jgi:hypothetical protein
MKSYYYHRRVCLLALSACPSILPHETTPFLLDGYSQNLIRFFFSENLSRIQLSLKCNKNVQEFTRIYKNLHEDVRIF